MRLDFLAEVLCVYREVEVLKKASAKGNRRGLQTDAALLLIER